MHILLIILTLLNFNDSQSKDFFYQNGENLEISYISDNSERPFPILGISFASQFLKKEDVNYIPLLTNEKTVNQIIFFLNSSDLKNNISKTSYPFGAFKILEFKKNIVIKSYYLIDKEKSFDFFDKLSKKLISADCDKKIADILVSMRDKLK